MRTSLLFSICVLVTFVSSTLFAHALTPVAPFSDVPPDHRFYEDISYVHREGIVNGYSDNTYRSYANINRAELTAIVVRSVMSKAVIDGCDLSSLPFPEDDVPRGAWFAKPTCAALNAGIISGYHDNTFRPGNLVSFAEAAKIIVKTYGKDYVEGENWYEGYVRSLGDSRAIPTDIVSFSAPISRGHMAQMIHRVRTGITTEESGSYEGIVAAESHGSSGDPNTFVPSTPSGSEQKAPPYVAGILDQFALELDVLPGSFMDDARDLLGVEELKDGNFSIYRKDNIFLFVEFRDREIIRSHLLVKGEVLPDTSNGLWRDLQGSRLHNLIVSNVKERHEQNAAQAHEFPDDLAAVIRNSYGGTIDLHAGTQGIAELTLHGFMREVLKFMNFPVDGLMVKLGREIPPFDWKTVASAVISQELKPTNYIEITRRGEWLNPMGMHATTMTDATIYYDDGNAFGFWGNGFFDGNKFLSYYKGPLIKSKDPKDYVEAQIGFGAANMDLGEYMKLIAAYNARFPDSKHGFLGPLSEAQVHTMNTTFDALDALPLEAVTVTNDRIGDYVIKPWGDLPGPEYFNMVLLGPLAESRDGTNGPLVRIAGTSRVLGQAFGTVDFQAGLSGAQGSAKGNLGLPLGSVAGQDLGVLGADTEWSVQVDSTTQRMSLKNTLSFGPFGGREMAVGMGPSTMSFSSPATCSFPFDVRASVGVSDWESVSPSSINFSPQGFIPDPSTMIGCGEAIFYLAKDGVVYAFNGTKKLVEMGVNELPLEEAGKIGAEGLKLAGGALSKGGRELAAAADNIPGLGEIPVLCGYKMVEDAGLCGVHTVTNGAKCGYEIITDAGKCGTDFIANGAVCGFKTITSAAQCGADYVANAAKCGTSYVANAAKCGYKTVTNGPQCGYESVTSGAQCGFETITNGAQCGFESFSCWISNFPAGFWGSCSRPKSCSVAKSCNVPKSCSVAASCHVPRSCNVPRSCEAPRECDVPKSCEDFDQPKSCSVPKSCEDPSQPEMC